MANKKAVSDEEVIAALLQHGTIKEAAAAVGISTRTIYDRMRDSTEFQGLYAEAKTSIARKAVFSINEKLSAAIDAVMEIMTDTEVNAAVRLQAAQTIINNAAKFSERLDTDERTTRQIGSRFSLF